MHFSHTAAVATLFFVTSSAVQAQTRSWKSGPDETDFGDVGNWTLSVPHENTIAVIGGSVAAENSDVILDQNRTIGALVMTDGMNLSTGGSRLTIDNFNGTGVIVSGRNVLPNNLIRSTTLTIEDAAPNFGLHVNDASIRITNGGHLFVKDGGDVFAHGGRIDTDSQSLISGQGMISMLMPGETSINNNGTIRAETSGGSLFLWGIPNGPAQAAVFDLDGSNETGRLMVAKNSQMKIVGALSESYDGLVVVESGGEFDISTVGDGFVRFGDSGDTDIVLNGTADAPSVLRSSDNIRTGSLSTVLVNGHAQIKGDYDVDIHRFVGLGDIRVTDNGSLNFGDIDTHFGGGFWSIQDGGTLDLKDTLDAASGVEVVLEGGRITGAGAGKFNNSDSNGIRGYGRFELPMSNDTFISADGGELVIDAGVGKVDWDGASNIGQLNATTGDLRLVDSSLVNAPDFNGTIRVGNGKTLMFDHFGFDLGPNSNVQLTGGIIDQNVVAIIHAYGEIEVFEASTWALRSHFEDSSDVKLGDDLRISNSASFHEGASFTGNGNLIIDNLVRFYDGASFDVDVIHQSQIQIALFNEVGVASINGDLDIHGDMDNSGRIVFHLRGDTSDLYDQLLISQNLTVRSGVFDVDLAGDFIPDAGDEFDILDFASFVDQGYLLQLPDLTDGLAWDTSDFTTLGTIRIAAVPEPASIALVVIGGVMMCRRRVA